jgi:hypothetical protein
MHYLNKKTGESILKKLCTVFLNGKIDLCQLGFIEEGIKMNLLESQEEGTVRDTVEVLWGLEEHFNDHIAKKSEYLSELVEELRKY